MKTLKSKRFTGILFLLVAGITSAFNTAVLNDENTVTIHSKIETSKEVAAKKAILIVLSAADTWVRADGAKYLSGYWAEEFIVIHEKFVNAGYDVHLATPSGLKPKVDPRSLEIKVTGEGVSYYEKYLSKISKDLESPKSLASINMNDYDAVIVPGGHGPVVVPI